MKITTHIDEKLLKDAMKAARAKTQRAVLEEGLRKVVAEKSNREFAKKLGTFHVSWTHERLMKSRE